MKKLWILPLAAVMMVACGETAPEEEGTTDGDATEKVTTEEEVTTEEVTTEEVPSK